jgi:hypothetical protein
MRAIVLLWSDGLAGQRDTVVALDGSGVQLGNNGGNLILQDDHGGQVGQRHLLRQRRCCGGPLRALLSLSPPPIGHIDVIAVVTTHSTSSPTTPGAGEPNTGLARVIGGRSGWTVRAPPRSPVLYEHTVVAWRHAQRQPGGGPHRECGSGNAAAMAAPREGRGDEGSVRVPAFTVAGRMIMDGRGNP